MAESISRFAAADLTTVMVGGPTGLRTEFTGVDGFVRAWADWLSPFDRYESEVLEITEATEDRLLIRTRQSQPPRAPMQALKARRPASWSSRTTESSAWSSTSTPPRPDVPPAWTPADPQPAVVEALGAPTSMPASSSFCFTSINSWPNVRESVL